MPILPWSSTLSTILILSCIFKIREECLTLPWSCTPITLNFLHSISSPLFPNNGINDVVEAGDGEVACSGYNLIFVKLTNGAIFMVYVFRPQLSLTGVRDPMATICHASPGTTEPSNSPREDSDDGWLAD